VLYHVLRKEKLEDITLIKEDTQKFYLGETSTQVNDFPYVNRMKK